MFNLFNKNKPVPILAAMTGDVIDITQVPDEMFADKIIGDGIAINPTDGVVVSPVKGEIIQVFPTKHALGIKTKEGLEILIHIGIDTVELKGEGFKTYIKAGDKVEAGDKLLKIDLDFIKKSGKSTISPIIITNMEKVKNIFKQSGNANKGKDKVMDITIQN